MFRAIGILVVVIVGYMILTGATDVDLSGIGGSLWDAGSKAVNGIASFVSNMIPGVTDAVEENVDKIPDVEPTGAANPQQPGN